MIAWIGSASVAFALSYTFLSVAADVARLGYPAFSGDRAGFISDQFWVSRLWDLMTINRRISFACAYICMWETSKLEIRVDSSKNKHCCTWCHTYARRIILVSRWFRPDSTACCCWCCSWCCCKRNSYFSLTTVISCSPCVKTNWSTLNYCLLYSSSRHEVNTSIRPYPYNSVICTWSIYS